jgi:hypothetical protein
MNRLSWTLLVILVGSAGLTAIAGMRMKASPGAAQTDRDRQRIKWLKKAAESIPADGQPHAEALETVHDFGSANPQFTGEHEFVIRNTGNAPLTLKRGPKSCKCTLSKLHGGC